MSLIPNNPSGAFFPTQTNISSKQDYPSLMIKKNNNLKDDTFNSSVFSPGLFKSKYNKQKTVSPELQSIINKIQLFVDDIDNKIQNRVQFVKQVYLNEYKQQVLEMSNQLKNLREKLDNEILKQRANEKMFYLEEQRDFFRSEVLKLNVQMNKLNQQNKNLKKLIDQQKRESQNYKKIVYNLQTKLLRIKNANIQRQKILQSQSQKNSNTLKNKNQSTVDTKNFSGSVTQRYGVKNLQTLQNQQEKQMSRTGYKLQGSKSYNKFSTPQREMMRSTAAISYPKKTTQKLQKIQGYSQLLQRQQIIDQCINELKKQIYYRNLSVGQRESKIHFNQSNQVKFEQFTKTDKKELIIKLLSSQKVLNQFYQFLFNKNSTSQLINSKLDKLIVNDKLQKISNTNKLFNTSKYKMTDSKFNTQMLSTLKTEFNKKIFDIKHNR